MSDKPDETNGDLETTKRIMERLVRTPPKPHKKGQADQKPTRPPALRKKSRRQNDQSDHD